jgi:hypothetical protein
LTGELEYAKFNKDSILSTADDCLLNLSASKQELELREQVAKEKRDRFLQNQKTVKNRFYL